jgi:hypothetical protein
LGTVEVCAVAGGLIAAMIWQNEPKFSNDFNTRPPTAETDAELSRAR